MNVALDPAALEATRPPLALFGSEPLRAAYELVCHTLSDALPEGDCDGHPVLVIPGLGSDGLALAPLRKFCASRGYPTLDWEYGRNLGPRGDIDEWLADLAAHVERLLAPYPARATLIGWSLGGLYARELAKLMRTRVRQVITLGTPFDLAADRTNVGWALRLVGGPSAAQLDEAMAARLRTPPPVPTTSIYSRADGVVAWQCCRHAGSRRRNVQDIEVEGSHLGMGWNPAVMKIVADRLAQPRRRWRRMAEA
jgi:pimeloyl-ACP methyl ester carboxylesterase